MTRRRPQGHFTSCPRCGKRVWTSGGIIGSRGLYAKFRGVCEECITEEERAEILEGQAGALLRAAGGR